MALHTSDLAQLVSDTYSEPIDRLDTIPPFDAIDFYLCIVCMIYNDMVITGGWAPLPSAGCHGRGLCTHRSRVCRRLVWCVRVESSWNICLSIKIMNNVVLPSVRLLSVQYCSI